MNALLSRKPYPEIVIGFVAPIGADVDETVNAFADYFAFRDYTVVPIKVTDIFRPLQKYLPPKIPLVPSPPFERYVSHISYGNQVREEIGPDFILAASTIMRIVKKRVRLGLKSDELFDKRVYLLYQFKREEEIDLLRSVYGRLFFQVSIYSRRGARVDRLARLFAGGQHTAMAQQFTAKAEEIIQDDENQAEHTHGQRVGKIFHDADFIVN